MKSSHLKQAEALLAELGALVEIKDKLLDSEDYFSNVKIAGCQSLSVSFPISTASPLVHLEESINIKSQALRGIGVEVD